MERVESCDLCGASLAVGEVVPGLETSPLVRCGQCGLVATSPRPTPQELPAYYEEGYYAHVPQPPSWRRHVVSRLKAYRGGYPARDPLLPRLAWRVAAALAGGIFLTNLPYRGPGRKLLDIGCGSGKTLQWAKEQGWEVYGVEWSAEAVEHAHQIGLDQVRHGEVEDQGYPDAFFDAITIYQVLEHVYSPSTVLREAHRVLKDDGTLWVSVPNFASYARWMLGETWYGMRIPIHLHHFTPTTLRALAERCGFQVAGVRFYSRLVTTYTTVSGFQEVAASAGAVQALRRGWSGLGAARGTSGTRWSDMMQLELRKGVASAGATE
jgi:2-polyprenyl-3-methyl-5-hydroxy-6-metoxy-1,4-benzoquinol methylase